jgi:hypothetical protein
MTCPESLRLLDLYVAALEKFHDGWEAKTDVKLAGTAWTDLIRARQEYLRHVETHGCRTVEPARRERVRRKR